MIAVIAVLSRARPTVSASASDPSGRAPVPAAAAVTATPGATPRPAVVWDAAAYRALSRLVDGDVALVRERARGAAAREQGEGVHPVASPFVAWALLADLPPEELPGPGTSAGIRARRAGGAGASTRARSGARKGAGEGAGTPPLADDEEGADQRPDARERRERRARLARGALAAWGAHVLGGAGVSPAAPAAEGSSADDAAASAQLSATIAELPVRDAPESVLARVVGGRTPQGHPAWNAYLVSLAHEIALDPSPERVRRLSGPLEHVRDRARFAEGEFADEFQDAIVAAYDSAAAGWTEETGVAERQAAVAAQRAELERAVVDCRVARGWGVLGKTPLVGDAAERRVREGFGAGVALWAAVLRGVVGGGVELEGSGWRRTLWTLELAFALGPLGADVLVSGDALVRRAAAEVGLADRVRGVGLSEPG